MTELRIGKRGSCSICGHKTDLPRWDGHYRNVRFILCGRCWGRYSELCGLIDQKLEEAA